MSALLATDASGAEFELAEAVVVNGWEIPRDDIYKEMQYHPAQTPREAIFAASRSLVLGHLLRERAHALGLCAADVELNGEAFDTAVTQLLERELELSPPSSDECREYFLNHPQKFVSEPLAEVRHILLAAAADDLPALENAREKAAQLLDQVRESGDPLLTFAQLAKSVSDCSSKDSGGSLGQIGRGDTVAPFEAAVFAQGVGLVPEPVETPYGVHLIYVEQCEPGRPLEFDFVRETIEDYLREARRRRETDRYLQALVADADIRGLDLLAGAERRHTNLSA